MEEGFKAMCKALRISPELVRSRVRTQDVSDKRTDEIGRCRYERLDDKEASDYWAERCREGVTAVMRVLSDPKNIYEGCKAVGLTDE